MGWRTQRDAQQPVMKRIQYSALWVVIILVLSLLRSVAQTGFNDPTFSQRGTIEGLINGVSVNDNGDIFIVGSFTSVYRSNTVHFAVLAPDGTLQCALPFEPTLSGLGSMLYSVAADRNGGAFVGGPNGMAHIEKVQGAGWKVDPQFVIRNNATASDIRGRLREVHSIAVSPGNDVWAACDASFAGTGFSKSYTLVAMTSSGGVDLGFTPPPGYVAQVKYASGAAGPGFTGKAHLLVAGSFGAGTMALGGGDLEAVGSDLTCVADIGGVFSFVCPGLVGKVVGGGSVGPNSGSPNYPLPFGMKLQRSEVLFEDLDFRAIPDRVNPDLDNGAWISAIEVFAGGDMLIAGNFDKIRGSKVRNIAHLWPDGSLDTTFQNQTSNGGGILDMAKQSDGKFVLVGTTGGTPVRGTIERRLAMLPASAATVSRQPEDKIVFEGEAVCITSVIDGNPAPQLTWTRIRNGVRKVLDGQNFSTLCLNSVTLADSGDYQLMGQSSCSSAQSRRAHLTVLPRPVPPGNDRFVDSIALSGTTAMGVGTLRGATVEAGEPSGTPSVSGASVWWHWTATANGPVVIDLSGGNFDAACSVYTGSAVSALRSVASNCHESCISNGEGGAPICVCDALLPQFQFEAVSGVTYHVRVGGTPPAGSLGDIVVRINPIVLDGRSLHRNPDGSFELSVSGPNGALVVIESTKSLNPANWVEISTQPIVNGAVTFSDASAASNARCYYRAIVK